MILPIIFMNEVNGLDILPKLEKVEKTKSGLNIINDEIFTLIYNLQSNYIWGRFYFLLNGQLSFTIFNHY